MLLIYVGLNWLRRHWTAITGCGQAARGCGHFMPRVSAR